MKSKKHHDEDLFYKFIFRKLKIRMHHYLGYGGKKMDFQNPEQVPLSKDDKFMDVDRPNRTNRMPLPRTL